MEIEGRPVAGRAVLSIRVLRGEALQIARMQDEHRALERMFSQMRGMLDAIPQPAWLRDPGGRLLWVNAAFARAVDARRMRTCSNGRSSCSIAAIACSSATRPSAVASSAGHSPLWLRVNAAALTWWR